MFICAQCTYVYTNTCNLHWYSSVHCDTYNYVIKTR